MTVLDISDEKVNFSFVFEDRMIQLLGGDAASAAFFNKNPHLRKEVREFARNAFHNYENANDAAQAWVSSQKR